MKNRRMVGDGLPLHERLSHAHNVLIFTLFLNFLLSFCGSVPDADLEDICF